MSEVNPSDLIEEIEYEVDDAEVIPSPIDPTLTKSGVAADAKATGDKIKAVLGGLKVNQKSPDANKEIILYAGDILMSSGDGAQTIPEAIQEANDKTAADITYDTVDGQIVTVKQFVDGMKTDLSTDMTEQELDDLFDEVFSEEDD